MLELPGPKEKKAQISLEFLIVYSFVLIIFIIMFALIATQRAASLVQQQYSLLQSQAQAIATYIDQAVSSGSGYSVTLPLLGGFITHSYNISISSTGVIILGTKSGAQPITAYAFSNAKSFVINGTLLPQSANGISIYQLQTYRGSISIYNSKGIIYINQQPVSTTNLAQGMLAAQQADVKAAQFNGAGWSAGSSNIIIPSSPSLGLTTQGAVSFWFYSSNAVANMCSALVSKAGGTMTSDNYMILFSVPACVGGTGSNIAVYTYQGGASPNYVSPNSHPLKPNTWYHVVWSYTSSTGGYLYINGVSQGSPVGSGTLSTNTDPMLIGGGYETWQSLATFQGSIADVQEYNTALTAAQVSALYANGLNAQPILTSNIVGWWPLNGNANDYSGYSNHGAPHSVGYQSVLQLSASLVPASNSIIKPIAGFVASEGSLGLNGLSVVNYTDSSSVAHAFLSSNGAVGSGSVVVDVFNGNTSTEGNLIGWWPLDTGYGNVAYDLSGKYNNGASSNVAWSSANRTDFAAASFPGNPAGVYGSNTQDGFITVNSAQSLLSIGINSTFTAVGWIYYKGATPSHMQGIFGDVPNWPPTGAGFQLVGYAGSVLYVNGSTVPFPGSSLSFPPNSWEMVTAQYNGSTGLANVYLNNTLFASNALPTGLGLVQAQPFYIGDDPWQSTGYDTFNGLITNLQLYSAFLTQSQIGALYAQGPASTPLGDSGLVSWWPLAGNAKDYSFNNNTGTAQYNVTFKNGNYTNNLAKGQGQGFAHFNGNPADGSQSTISVPSINALQGNNGPFTISLWFRANRWFNPSYETIIMQNENWQVSGFRIGIWNPGQFGFWTTQGGGTINLATPYSINANRWYHAVIVYNNQAAVLYLNGVNVVQTTGTYIGNTNPLVIGPQGGTDALNGSIADVQIYNTALTQQQVLQLYAQGFPPQSRLNVSLG